MNDPHVEPLNIYIYRSSRYSFEKSKATCIICNQGSTGLRFVPRSARADVLIQQGDLVSDGVKCCIFHLKYNLLRAVLEVETSKLRKVS